MLAPDMRSRQPELGAQEINEMLADRNGARGALAVHGHGDCKLFLDAHWTLDRSMALSSARWVSTRWRWSLVAGRPNVLSMGSRSSARAAQAASRTSGDQRLPLMAAMACMARVGLTSLPK